MTDTVEQSRFRSFAERYLIERASTFTVGNEVKEAWDCTLDALSIYRRIKSTAGSMEVKDETANSP